MTQRKRYVATTRRRDAVVGRPRARVTVAPRSFLDAGTEVLPGERKFTDYAFPPNYSSTASSPMAPTSARTIRRCPARSTCRPAQPIRLVVARRVDPGLLRLDVRRACGLGPILDVGRDRARKVGRVPPTGTMPCWANFAIKSGSRSARFTSTLMRSMIGLGMPAVVSRPIHWIASNPGKPCSATVGRSGSCGSRMRLPVAIARRAPAWICGSDSRVEIAVKWVSPADHRRHRRAAAAIGDVLQLDAGLLAEQFDHQAGLRGGAGRGVVELAGLGLGERDELGQRFRRHLRVDQEQQRILCHQGDRREIALDIVGQRWAGSPE